MKGFNVSRKALGVLGALFFLAVAPSAKADTLEEALEREATLLRSEKEALQQELNRATQSAETARSALNESIDKLGAELARLNASESATLSPLILREKLRSLETRDRRIQQLTRNMERWLENRELETPEQQGAARLPELVALILNQVEKEGRLELRTTEYFTEDGSAQQGEVLHIGGVAAIAWQVPFKPLVGEPGGTLRMVNGVTPLKKDRSLGIELQSILFDATRPAPEGFSEPSQLQRFKAGGPLMWVLAGLALAAALVALERAFGLWAAQRTWNRLQKQNSNLKQNSKPLFKALAAPLEAIAEHGETSREIAHERANELLAPLQAHLMARLSVIATVAAVAPLVGLLGTVTGMIATFSVLTTQGSGDPQSLSGGISEALLTTQLGLAVAVPTLLSHTILKRWASRICSRVEVEALDRLHGKTNGAHERPPAHEKIPSGYEVISDA